MPLRRSSPRVEPVGGSDSPDANRRPQPNGGFADLLLEPFKVLWRWIRVEALLIAALIEWFWVAAAQRSDAGPAILRRFLERAGGTWIKLGQILAMRSDFLAPATIAELSKLLDQVPPFPFDIAKRTVESELGRPLNELFANFPATPVASASFGQVYRATLLTGEEVAVKVMRPGLGTIIRADLIQLRITAFFVDTFRLFGSIRLKRQIDQLEKILHEETDYRQEAENIRFAVETSRYFPIMKIPGVVEGFCCERVLTMEFLNGLWMNEILAAIRDRDEARLQEFRQRGVRLKLVAQRMFDIGMRQLFEIGSFHADPHAANIVVLPGNVIGYVDFGIVGRMDEELAELQSRYLQAVKDGRINDAARALSESVVIPENVQNRLPDFRAELGNQVRNWIIRMNHPQSALREKSIARLLLDNLRLIRGYGFELMDNTMRYYRALIIADVTVLQLNPDFDTVRNLRRYFRNRQVRQFRMKVARTNFVETAAEYFSLWADGPRISQELSRSLRRDGESFGVAVAGYAALWRGASHSFLILLLIVLAARLLGNPDISGLLKFPVSLNWRWFAPTLLGCWRIAAMLTR